jgi:starch phosphorylase
MKNKKIIDSSSIEVAYFSMEFAFFNDLPNYAGGLGVLAADMMYSCVDLGVKAVGISLIYHQDDNPKKAFSFEKYLQKCKETVTVKIENRWVKVAIWKLELKQNKNQVPIFFLSTNLAENEKWDRDITKNLYASDRYTRLCQEAILGIGGVRALEVLGYKKIKHFHLNEGHCSLLTLELLRRYNYNEEKVRSLCSFTTHTPISSGHDYFDYDLAYQVIEEMLPWDIKKLSREDKLGMTELALSLSQKTNSVSLRHQKVCRKMFPGKKIDNVTNGVNHCRWAGDSMKRLFDRKFKDWRNNPQIFEKSGLLPDEELFLTHQLQKEELVNWINRHNDFFPFEEKTSEDYFSRDILTIGFARRFVPYKRPELIFQDEKFFEQLGHQKMQLVFAGRCNPADQFCNTTMHDIEYYTKKLRGKIKIALIPDYNLDIAKRLVSGCDVWLNSPIPPQEASGTSGMKAALNGCLNLSIPDGWWLEGFEKYPQSGWNFGNSEMKLGNNQNEKDAQDLMLKLGKVINCYYEKKRRMDKKNEASYCITVIF